MIRSTTLSLAVIAALAAPVAAQDQPLEQAPEAAEMPDAFRDGFNLLSEGTKLILRGLGEELVPLVEDLGAMIDDLNAYHPPEMQLNGDIILRRKVPPEAESPDADKGQVDL